MSKGGLIACIASPTGGGKTTVCRELTKRHSTYRFSISYTTRKPRPEEVDGADYHFVSDQEFERKLSEGAFAEYEEVHSDRYATPLKPLTRALDDDEVILVDIDVKGAMTLKRIYPDRCVTIFIQPPSLDVLKQRLSERGTESHEEIQNRLTRIELERQYGKQFDLEVINNELSNTVKIVENYIENARINRMEEINNGS